jgi:hypothetical protein
MQPSILLMTILLTVIGLAQGQSKRIGVAEFFGYAGIDLDKVKGVLPFREGSENLLLMSFDARVDPIQALRYD